MYGNNMKQEMETPIVQGYAADGGNPNYYPNEGVGGQFAQARPVGGGDFNGGKGEVQPKKANDVIFAVAFCAHLGVMGFLLLSALATQNGNADAANENNNNGGGDNSYTGFIYFVSTLCVFSIGLSSVALGLMMKFSKELVKAALFFSIGCSFVMGIIGLMIGNILMEIIGMASFAIGICYARAVWHRIPFAAANLNTALTAVRANLGLSVVAYFFLALTFGWIVWWSIATAGMVNAYGSGITFLFFLSYFWTHQVIQNTMQVTSAGVIGTWWFVPEEASSFCSSAITDSLTRATTYSFGSICFGSLLVALVQALRQLHRQLHDRRDFQILVCVVQCILACIEDIIEYLNKWAYVYVGLYGYSYLDAGKNVLQLFQNKGWTVIITDDLCDNALGLVSFAIGLITGVVGQP